jgi:hypothetical protein
MSLFKKWFGKKEPSVEQKLAAYAVQTGNDPGSIYTAEAIERCRVANSGSSGRKARKTKTRRNMQKASRRVNR